MHAQEGVHFSVVLPPFFGDDTAAADRTRVHHGTMHPKLWLLEFDSGGPADAGFLRLVISSANLGRYDAKINNQQWCCDFAPTADALAAVRALDKPALRAELEERGVDELRGAELHERQTELLRARRADSADFGADLRRFLRALLASAAPPLWEAWQATLDKYELTPPAGTHLILSVPGRFSTSEPVSEAELGYAPPAGSTICEADLYGLNALRRHLEPLEARRASERPSRVEFGCSSMGQLEDIIRPLFGCHPAGTTDYSKIAQKIAQRPGAFLTGFAPGAAVPKAVPKAVLVWPSLTETLPAFARGSGLLTIGGGKNTMTGPSDIKCSELKNCTAHNVVSSAHRAQTLHHVKLAAGIILDDEGASAAAAGAPSVGPRCAWLYAGSHNLSGAAWGKFEAATAEAATATDAMSDDDGEEEEMSDGDGEEEFVLMSYEIGVLLVPPRPRRFALPWRSPALK